MAASKVLAAAGRVMWLAAVGWALAAGHSFAAADAGAARPVLVELFTAQGCSSCPPAEKLLSQLGAAGLVVALEYHVDYWNHDGWTDPFSRAEWTRRQQAYARVLDSARIYTPQAVVDGQAHVVGNDPAALRSATTAAAARPAAVIGLTLEPAGEKLLARVTVDRPEALSGRPLDLMLAIYENGLVTEVRRGENGGRTLRNDFVVRSLRRGVRLAAGSASQTHTETLALASDWQRSGLGVVAFLQDPKSLEIHGAAMRALADAERPRVAAH